MTKRSLKHTAQGLTLIIFSGLLLFILIASWVPRDCPLIRQWFAPCKKVSTVTIDNLSPEERETQRIGHQVIDKDYVDFNIQAQNFRATTDVYFTFRADFTKHYAYLNVRNGNNLDRIALITHPLLANLDWQRYSSTLPNVSMYQRTEKYTDPLELKANLPAAKTILIDSIIAKAWGLQDNQYTLLDTATSLDGINYVVTSYSPLGIDGTWRTYRQTFDFSKITIDESGNIFFLIYAPDVLQRSSIPFLLSPIHVDYRSMK